MVIKFNKKIYSLKAIKLAIKDYQELADFNLEKKGKYIQVKLTKIDKEFKSVIKEEFCNYILSLMKTD